MLTLPPLYAILDVEAVNARSWAPADVCRAWLAAGVRLIQLRAKDLASGPFLDLADEAMALCRDAGARLIINDRADIAAMAGASGVHIGQDDLSPADARRVVGPFAIVGLSTHEAGQMAAAVLEPISYVAIGPVFATATKDTGYEPLGPQLVQDAAAVARRAGLPLVAIGGITLDRAQVVLEAGADSVAVITDLLISPDLNGVEDRAREWLTRV